MSKEIDREGLLLPFEERFDLALQTWDPLPDSPLLKWLDPVGPAEPGKRPRGRMRPLRFLAFIFIATVPPVVLSLLPSQTAGGRFWAEYGMRRDLYIFFQYWVTLPLLTFLVLYGRRVLGDMVNRLNLAFAVRIPIQQRGRNAPKFLKVLEWLSRVNWTRSLLWAVLFVLINALGYVAQLKAPEKLSYVSPATPGTFFYFARLGDSQPNLAGVYSLLVNVPLTGYIILLLGRLIIEFSLACAQLAKHLRGHIMPAHPDGSGGLLPVGRTALILSLPILLIGLQQTAMTLQELIIWHRHPVGVVSLYWFLYVLLCPLLFMLPVFPLRRLMYTSKHAYLLKLEAIYRAFDSTEAFSTATDPVNTSRIPDQSAVVDLIERASEMSVWPFDKRTFWRFTAIVISPLLPLLGSKPGELAQKVLEWLTHMRG